MPEVDVNDVLTPGFDNSSDPTTPSECDDGADAKKEFENADSKPVKEEKEEDEWRDILGNGEVRMKVLRKGEENTSPRMNDLCVVKIVCKLDDGKVVEEHECLKIQPSDHEVVQGLEIILLLMNVGEKAVVVVSPRFGYGSVGNPPDVPPDATLTYTVEMLKVDTAPDLEKVTYDERKELANAKRERGNWWYYRDDVTKAANCYRKALDLLDESVPYIDDDDKRVEFTEDMIKNVIDLKSKVYNNLAAAQLKMEAYESALSSVNEVIKYDPRNVKALFRKSKILCAKGSVDEAVDTLREALTIQPDNVTVQLELSKCVKEQQVEKQHAKILYKKMLGRSGKDDTDRSKGRSRLWAKVLGTAASATIMAAVAVAISYKFKNYPFI